MDVNWNSPRPTADVNAVRHRPRLESDVNANPPRLELNSRVSRPRAEVDSSWSPHRSESDLKPRRPHGQVQVDPIDLHDLSDNDQPSFEADRPRQPQWESAAEVDRKKPRKRVDPSNVDYEKIYPKDKDLANYELTPQNNLWTKAKNEGRGKPGQPRDDRHTNWTEKMRKYHGTAHTPKLHQYNTAYTYRCHSPYRLTYLNSKGFSHTIDKPKGVAALRPYSGSNGRLGDPDHARIQSNGRRKRDAVDEVKPQPRVESPPDELRVDTYSPDHHLDTPRATIHAPNPVRPRAAVTVEPPSRPALTMHRQSPELYDDVPLHSPDYNLDTPRATIHAPTPVKPRAGVGGQQSTRRRPTFNIRPPNFRVPQPKVPISNLRVNARKPKFNTGIRKPVTPTVQVQGPRQSPELHVPDVSLHSPDHHLDTPRANIKALNPAKPRTGFNIHPPNFSVPKPQVPLSNLQVNARNPKFNTGIRKPVSPTVQVQGPRQSPELYADESLHSPDCDLDTPRANIHAPNPAKPRSGFNIHPPNFSVPKPQVPISNFRLNAPNPNVNAGATKPVAPTVQVQGPHGPRQNPELHADVPAPHVQATASPRKRRTRKRGCCACGSDVDVAPVEPPRAYARVDTPPHIPDTRLDRHDPPRASVRVDTPPLTPDARLDLHEPPRGSVRAYTPPLTPDARLNLQKPPRASVRADTPPLTPDASLDPQESPRAYGRVDTPPKLPGFKLNRDDPNHMYYELETESPRLSPAVELDTPTYSIKPPPPVHIKANSPRRLPAIKHQIASPTVRVSAPKPVAKPTLKVVKPSVHVVKPKAEYRVQTPKLNLRAAPKLKPINTRKPNVPVRSPNFSAPKPKVQVSNPRVAAPKPILDVGVKKPVAPTAKVQGPRIKVKEPEVPKAEVNVEAPKPKVQAGIGAPKLKPVKTSSINLRGPERVKPKITTPRLAPKVDVYTPKPIANPTFADLQINAPKLNPIHTPSVPVNTPEKNEPDPITPKAEFHVDVPKPTVKPLRVDADVPAPRPQVRSPVSSVPEMRDSVTPPNSPLPSPELQTEFKPPKGSLPPVSKTYYPPAPNVQLPPLARPPPASVTLPKLPKPPRVAARVDPPHPVAPIRMERYPRDEKPLPPTSKSNQPPKTEPLKWRLRPDEPKKGTLQSSPPVSPSLGNLTYYPPSNVAPRSPRLRAEYSEALLARKPEKKETPVKKVIPNGGTYHSKRPVLDQSSPSPRNKEIKQI